MRVLLTGPPLHGHMTPLLAVGAALRRAGHDVHVLCVPDFSPAAAGRGITAHEYRSAWSPGDFSVPRVDIAARRAHTVFDDYRRSTSVAFTEVADRLSPHVVVADTVASYVRRDDAPFETTWLSPTLVSPGVVETPLVAGRRQPLLVTLAPFLQQGASRLPSHVHLVGTDAPAAPPSRGPRARLFVSAGTSFNDDLTLFVDAATACDGTDLSPVVATGASDAATRLSRVLAGTEVHAWVDQGAELTRAAVFITAGGAGSIQQAVLAGTPLIVVPQSPEQRSYATAVAAAGVGVVLEPSRVTPDALTRRISLLRASVSVRDALRTCEHEIRALEFAERAVRVVEESVA